MHQLHKNQLLGFLLALLTLVASSQTPQGHVRVDEKGILRWEKTNEEVTGFGVNYSVPFAHAFRSAKKLGVNPKEAIDNDVYHFSRLGFDLYRLHVWDTQISDTLGNLLENEYLDAFDYLLGKLKEHQINYVITPIAFWGNGWPEPDTPTPGFSYKYGKGECLTNPEAIKAQQNYLFQFLNHVNPYTGLAYKNDPSVIAFEVSNEPHHRGEGKVVTQFVKGMVKAMRKTGTKKPIFYNTSHGVHFADDYFKAGIDGGTFQWYPTGLGYGREIPGNVLPNVNEYQIPFDAVFKKYGGAKLVYEFDAADVGRSYPYPAMARSFREAGIQIATHFAYDPTYLAYANTEYNTHYMNLNYTPHKALALAICAEVFREVPIYSDQGEYPNNLSFGNFDIQYENDVAIYNSLKKFIYTNTTLSEPKNENQLERILGHGSSTLVDYEGTGAYFLDKIEDGVWRLEIMPDVIWVDNPFGRNGLNKTVGAISWNHRNMNVKLKDLGSLFKVANVNATADVENLSNTSFSATPGVYLLIRKDKDYSWNPKDPFEMSSLDTYFAPVQTLNENYLVHEPATEIGEGSEYVISAQFIGKNSVKKMSIITFTGRQRMVEEMTEISPFTYKATIPSESVLTGTLSYYLDIEFKNGKHCTYPGGKEGQSFDWDFGERTPYEVRVVPSTYPIHLYDAKSDAAVVVSPWRRSNQIVPTKNFNEAEFQLHLDKLFTPDNENLNAKPIYDYSFKHYVLDKIEGRKAELSDKKELIIKARSLNNKILPFQVAIVLADGKSFGAIVQLTPEMKEHRIPLSDLKEVKTVTLPRPYPTFLPYFFEHRITTELDINQVEALQFSIGPGIDTTELTADFHLGIISVRLE